ncbi:hypothetical protein Ahy_A03g012370 isoform B [Arachis hypogaea]|uniref:Uncharacterized protein n=1 Tax=Arachis hypogaea TaxID=3818 RepID=A0A445DT90_ARAHY|nr:hypothetical protein Ahy_A03g012370 isoform B [Arachis hypogaea]
MSGVALEGFASLCLLSHCRKGVDNSAIGISRTKSMHGVDHRNHFGNLIDITTIGTREKGKGEGRKGVGEGKGERERGKEKVAGGTSPAKGSPMRGGRRTKESEGSEAELGSYHRQSAQSSSLRRP